MTTLKSSFVALLMARAIMKSVIVALPMRCPMWKSAIAAFCASTASCRDGSGVESGVTTQERFGDILYVHIGVRST